MQSTFKTFVTYEYSLLPYHGIIKVLIVFLLDHIVVEDVALQWVDNRVGRCDLSASIITWMHLASLEVTTTEYG